MTALILAVLAAAVIAATRHARRPRRLHGYAPTITRLRPLAPLRNAEE